MIIVARANFVSLFRSSDSALKRSQPALHSASSRSTPLVDPPKFLVKLIHINGTAKGFQRLPLVFVHHDRTILMPDFNICTLLNTINAHVDIHSIEDYVRTDASMETKQPGTVAFVFGLPRPDASDIDPSISPVNLTPTYSIR